MRATIASVAPSGAEDARASRRPAERIRDVAGNLEGAVCETSVGSCAIDCRDGGKTSAQDACRASICLLEAEPERREHAEAAVIRRTAADADDEAAAAVIEGRADEFTESVRRGVEWIALLRWHECEPRGIRHLDDRRLCIGQQAIAALNLGAQRSRHSDGDDAAVQALHHGVHCSFATIGQGEYRDIILWIDIQDGLPQEPAGIHGGDASFE